MHIMRKLSLRMKFTVGFGVVLLILVVVGALSYSSFDDMAALSAEAAQKAHAVMIMQDIESRINDQKAEVRGFLLDGTRREEMERYVENDRRLADDFSKLEPFILTEKGKQLLAQTRDASDGYHKQMANIAELRRNRRVKQATALLYEPQTVALRDKTAKALTALIDRGSELAAAARQEQEAAESKAKTRLMVFVGVGLAVGFAMATYIARNIAGRISQMATTIQAISENDLSMDDMQIRNADEIGSCGSLLNGMKNSLRQIVQTIAKTAEQVASASEELSSSASLQAQGAETQKDQTSQVATAMQEMSATVLQVSENSNKAAEASGQAAETAREGGAIVEETLTKMRVIADSVGATAKKMEELGKSSDQIGRIAGVIDDIADQTNLLALNAAIEAARAGEQGRGFAVVADEVRKLAERTTTATKEIAQMIKTIQDETKTAVTAMEAGIKQVEDGVQSTNRAGDSLKQIIHMSEQVGEMITHIATAATEQSSASEEVNNNMEMIAKLVKESADGAQQSAKACQDLSGLALDLQQTVSNFRLGDEHRNSYSGGSRPRPAGRKEAPKAMAASPS